MAWADVLLKIVFPTVTEPNSTASTMTPGDRSIFLDLPTLADNRLFEGRDLAPTLDVRSVFKGVLRDHLGVDRAALDGLV